MTDETNKGEKLWAFNLGDEVQISRSGEDGTVEGRCEYVHHPDSFFVEYTDGQGSSCTGWFRADELSTES